MQQTSLLAFDELRNTEKLGDMQKEVYLALHKLGEATDLEISKFLHFADPNKSRPRRNDLVRFGLVEESHKRKCSVSGKLSIVWKIKGGN